MVKREQTKRVRTLILGQNSNIQVGNVEKMHQIGHNLFKDLRNLM